VDEGVGFLFYDLIDRFEEIFIHRFLGDVHAALRIEAIKSS